MHSEGKTAAANPGILLRTVLSGTLFAELADGEAFDGDRRFSSDTASPTPAVSPIFPVFPGIVPGFSVTTAEEI